MKKFILALMLALGCSSVSLADAQYFPKKISEAHEGLSAHREQWYSKHLRAMNEVPIYGANGVDEIYRFTWLRTFNSPMVFRLQLSGDGRAELFVKQSDGHGGYEPGKLTLSKKVSITPEQLLKFRKGLEAFDFWNAPQDEQGMLGTDGAQWIFEGRKKSVYHIIDRWSPEGGAFAETMLYLIKLSGAEVGDVY